MVDQIDPAAYVPPPVAPAGNQSGFSGRQQQGGKEHRQRAPAVDVAAILGQPEQMMPVALQETFLVLVEQVERLREELDRVKLHESYLITAADKHPLLPALNRRAFMGALARLLQTSERAELPGSLALLHVAGIESVREQEGLAAGDAALAFVAQEILTELRQTDLLGYLDSSDFAIALAVAEADGAEAKIDRIVTTLSATPFLWGNRPLRLRVTAGTIHFEAGMTAESLLTLADQAMMSGTSALSN